MKEILVKTQSKTVESLAKQAGFKIIHKPKPFGLIKTAKDEEHALNIAKGGKKLFVKCIDWKIIPLENLIASTRGKTQLIPMVNSAIEAKLALQVMEIGADGILLETNSVTELKKLQKELQQAVQFQKIKLEEATVTKIQSLGLGSRSCIDTCTIMEKGQGLLVGASSQGMVLVEAEVTQNKSVNTRPFRVNAGTISLYTLTRNNKTKYLEESQAGDEVLIVQRDGSIQIAAVARNKIEIRPMVLIEAVSSKRKIAKAILQNAETVRLITPKNSKSITDLKKGDCILARFEEGGRHFGVLFKEETIIEK